MPNVFEKLGIRFLYPDNWTLDEQEAIEGNESVTVVSPGGAFWSIVLHPDDDDPNRLATTALKTLQAEYADSEVEAVAEVFGEVTAVGYDVNFFYLDLTNTAVIRVFPAADAMCLVLCQAEDREYVQLEQVFRAITTSLIASDAAG